MKNLELKRLVDIGEMLPIMEAFTLFKERDITKGQQLFYKSGRV